MRRERAAALLWALTFEVVCTLVIAVLLLSIGACLYALVTGAA